jgi:ABC-type transport system substrate-binding protein
MRIGEPRILHWIIGFLTGLSLISNIASAQTLVALDCSNSAAHLDCARASGGTTSYSLIATPSTLNPITASDTASLRIQDPIFGTYSSSYALLGSGTLGTAPQIASVIELSQDGTSVKFTLRSGIAFSDGSPITTDDILYWYNDVILNPNLPNEYQNQMTCPSDGTPFALSQISSTQLEMSCPSPFRSFLKDAASMPVLSKQMALDLIQAQNISTNTGVAGPRATREFLGLSTGSDANLRSKIRSTGPFVLTSFDSQSLASYERNTRFYETDSNGKALPYLDGLNILIIPTAGQNLALSQFVGGQTDLLALRPSDIALIYAQAAQGGFSVNNDIDNGSASSGTNFVTLNFDDSNPALADVARRVNVRRALSLAIDRVAVVNNVFFGIATPQYLPVELSGESHDTFFLGRNNTCSTFVTLHLPCQANASGADAVTVREGLQIQVKNLPPPGASPEADQHLQCLVSYENCIAKANSLLDQEGLKDKDHDGIRNLANGENWRIQVTVNSGGLQEEKALVVCDGWRQIGIDCSVQNIPFYTLVSQLLGSTSWTGAIVIGLTGGDPSGDSVVAKCGGVLHIWHISCNPGATSGPTAEDAGSAAVETAFDAGYLATSVEAAQRGFDQYQLAWLKNEPYFELAIQNSLFAVRTDRLCNDGRSVAGNLDIKFRVDLPGNTGICQSNIGR